MISRIVRSFQGIPAELPRGTIGPSTPGISAKPAPAPRAVLSGTGSSAALCANTAGQSNTNLPPAPPGGASGNKPDVLPQSFTLPAFAVSPCLALPLLSCSSANEPQLPQLRLPITQVPIAYYPGVLQVC